MPALETSLPRDSDRPARRDRVRPVLSKHLSETFFPGVCLMPATVSPSSAPIEFIDLGAQRQRIGPRMDEAIRRVVDHGRFILGPEVAELERRLAEFCGVKHVL